MKFLVIFIFLIFGTAIAVVPTTDVGPTGMRAQQQMAQDATTMGQYAASVSSTMTKISQTMQITDQMKNLQGLQKLQGAGTLCELCTKTDQSQLMAYSNSINSDLCSQFSLSYQNLTGIKNAANSLGDIMKLLNTNPQAALMSLQQAGISAQQTTNSTLGQMQLLQTQVIQKELAKEKMEQQTATSIGNSLKNSPL